ncbi:MAG: fibronectin type III domain-containing protein [Minisyncoccia bacterium]|jgi:hypothetical protein
MRLRLLAPALVVAFALAIAAAVVHQVIADNSPVISNVQFTNVEATSTTVTWTTDRKTDSFIEVSEDTDYCGIRNAGELDTAHSIAVLDLIPGTTYFFRIRATDVNSNQSYSGDYTFTTTSTMSVPTLAQVANVEQKNLAARAIAAIQGITNAAAFSAVAQALSSQEAANVGPPKILGDPQLDIGADQVAIAWNTDVDADGSVYVASDAEYRANPGNYTRKDDDPNGNTQTHAVTVYGLTPSTLYHYKVSSRGTIGQPGESNDLTFTTKSLLPQILSLRLAKIEEHGATVSWATPLPTAGTVEYTNMSTRKTLSVGDPAFLVTHNIQLNDLIFQTRYSVVIRATNQAGDVVTSQPLYFVTTKNLIPPVISQVNNDSALYPGQETTVQTIVSWQTDEPASCNLSYVPGIVKNDKDTVNMPAETGLLQKHVSVVTSFAPGTVYKYWVTCTDADGNATSSEDFVLLTPEQEKSIIDIIVGNFKSTFGWLNGLGGGGGTSGK